MTVTFPKMLLRASKEKTVTELVSESDEKIVFLDEDESSEESFDDTTKNVSKRKIPIIPLRSTLQYLFVNTANYPFRPWQEFINQYFPDKQIQLRSLIFNSEWDDFFNQVENKPYFKNIENKLSQICQKGNAIVPHPELLFNAFNLLSPQKIKVVFIGQDPYADIRNINGQKIPQAVGLCFSVPFNYPIPPSLRNIYQNLKEHRHIKQIPEHGCLAGWEMQGCFMINAALTTIHQQFGAHREIWKDFTVDLINYLNTKMEHLVFVCWGRDAHMLCLDIDPRKHHLITTSHPSPNSYLRDFQGFSYGKNKDRKKVIYPSFQSVDHFGKINHYLRTVSRGEIIWDI